MYILAVFLASAGLVQAADAASRSAAHDAVSRGIAAGVKPRTGMMGGSSSSSFFFGLVPGLLVTDPVQVSSDFATPMTVDYGDGTQITYQPGDTPTHTYTTGGSYAVKAVIGDKNLITVNLSFVVPFDSTVANVFGMGVTPDFQNAGATVIEFTYDGSQTGTLDFGDGSEPVTVDGSVALNASHVYAKGFWNAILSVNDGTTSRTGSVSFTAPLTSGKLPEVDISGVTVTPNPATAGQPVDFSGTVSVKNISGDTTGYLDFGDGSPSFSITGSVTTALKETIQHTYAADGVYTALLTVYGSGASASVAMYVVVGKNSVVNSLNGVFATQEDDGGGNIGLQLNATALAGTIDASTTYDDTQAGTGGPLTRDLRAAPLSGFLPTRAFVIPTVAVATSNLLGAGGVVRGKIRKTIAVGSRQVGDSSGLASPASTEITLSKMSGKFLFNKTTPDQLSFSGTFSLPPGFDPAKTGGNPVVIGIGNIVDTLFIDAKGKPLDKSTGVSQRIKKLSVKFPKLSGPAVGGETAKLDVTLSLADMDTVGLDTEGITAQLRSDEKKLKTAPRFIQVNLLLSGVPFQSYVPVQYKVSPKGDAGQLSGRAGH